MVGAATASVRRSAITLADGRELFFFDEVDPGSPPDRSLVVDNRELPPPPAPSQLRWDLVREEWVTVASHRQTRTHLPPDDECPLCPSREAHSSEIPAEDYDVVVFQNRFPSFSPIPSVDGLPVPPGHADPLLVAGPGVGRCEVVCFTADHETAFSGLTARRVRTVIEAWADRTAELSARDDVEQVFCFENRGEEIGVTLSHPHGQVYGYPYVTPYTTRSLASARTHRERTGGNLFADLLAAERAQGDRVVLSTERWTAFVPYAARWPMEVHVYPHRQVPDLPALDADERHELAELYLDLLGRMETVYDDTLPYIAGWHQAPVRQDRDLAYLHLELFSIRRAPGKLKHLAGSESAMGAFVNDISPERTAQALREAGR